MQLPAFPTHPADLPSLATIDELLGAYHQHMFAVVAGRSGAEVELSRHALAALAIGQAVIDTFIGERWPLVRDVLVDGGTADEVGGALGGLEVQEVAAGLASWADRERRAGVLSLDEYDGLLELISGGAR